MNACIASQTGVSLTHEPNAAARRRMLASRGEPLVIAGWRRALMIHFEVEPEALQRAVPFPLDLRNGRAHVSLVASTVAAMSGNGDRDGYHPADPALALVSGSPAAGWKPFAGL